MLSSFLVCALLACIMLNSADLRLENAHEIARELFWLKASFCIAALGYAMGEIGVTSLLETISSRK